MLEQLKLGVDVTKITMPLAAAEELRKAEQDQYLILSG
jgi:hypothetical protein